LALEERLAEGEAIPTERVPQMRQVTVQLAEPSTA
jgi:hypothetical protein